MQMMLIVGIGLLIGGCIIFVMKSMQPNSNRTGAKTTTTSTTTTTQVVIPNRVAVTVRLFGLIIFIGGIFVGGISLKESDVTQALTIWFSYTFYATMLFGFAEIIQLLQDIKNK